MIYMMALAFGVLFVLVACAYTYRDYYEKGCCTKTNETQETKQKQETENRPYTHP